MKFPSIPRVLAYLWHSKKIWRKPRKAKVLIYDRCGSEVLLTYIDPKSVEILDLRGESLNLYVLFKCLLNLKLSPANYIFQYLTCVKPGVALTFIDNKPSFYLLKNYKKKLITVCVQNGLRGELSDPLLVLEQQVHSRNKYKVDYMLVFGNAIGRENVKYIEGKTLPIGSFKNNLYQTRTQKSSKSVLFLSQYRPPPSPESSPMLMQGNKPIFWKQFYSAEEFLLPLLQKYCLQNELVLKICLCSSDQTKQESNYFKALLGNESFELIKKSNLYSSYENLYSSYENVVAAGVVIFIDSTLGYEALARGKKTAAFTLRGKLKRSVSFGWPADLPDNGPFWTNHADECEFKRVMDYITTVKDEEWEQARQHYVPELMEYDPGNTRFLKLMRDIGVPLKREYKNDLTID
jgi:surface carbohydrate biosynthesis protein